MLVLERTLNESFMISEESNVKVTVLELMGHHVRLGIEAPRNIAVHRKEIYESLKFSKKNK